MRTSKLLIVIPFLVPVVLSYACGGGDANKPVENPSSSATGASSTTTTTTSATAAASSAAPVDTKPPEPEYVLGITAAKFTPDKTAKLKAIEVKDDGTVNLGGKATYKIVYNELRDSSGAALLRASKDGTVTQGDGKAFGKFDDKDVMQVPPQMTITIADDGSLKVLEKPGSPSKTMKGKFDKVDAKGRRALAMIVGIEWMFAASLPK